MLTQTDLIGKKFGKLTVVNFWGDAKGDIKWNCLCDCGAYKIILQRSLTRIKRRTESCGRCKRAQDLTGKRFGKLFVVGFNSADGRNTFWNCQCDCGNHVVVRRSNLTNKSSKSCGCLRRDHGVKLGKMFGKETVHGYARRGTRIPIYKTWVNMRQRCYDDKNKAYRYYGGRGISVCSRWFKFENFLADMGPKPEGLTIDRINSEGHYMPSNCRWATRQQQSANRNYKRIYA